MRNIKIIARRELGAYFGTPLAYIFVIIFVALTGAFAFFIGNFFERGQADLQAFFVYHPWLYLLLVPAIAMRLWAEERKSGTIELLMTLPVSTGEAIIGKFLAAWAFIGVALLLTVPMWLTVNYLGRPDNGVIFASYIGSFLMAGAFLAIGSAISALTKNQVIAFIVSATLCFLFVMSGAEMVLNVVRRLSPGAIVQLVGVVAAVVALAISAYRSNWGAATAAVLGGVVAYLIGWLLGDFGSGFVVQAISALSFLSHFDQVSKGVISLSTLIFYASLIGFFLFANVVIVEMRKAA
ncbi:MAG TPA: ABC transporter permease subunit [Hyphomicrobiaceae bacterium]|nr:ABC transporter permease subunit [Hyphomicrobiaceae bacterium]